MRGLLAVAAFFCLSAQATPFATDASDLWYNTNESGWGANVIQQDDTLFITFFVYASNGAATWYVAPATSYTGSSGGGLVYSGPLYQTSGPWFGGPAFNPNAVNVRQVGTATFTLQTVGGASLTYVADGVAVSKSLTRQTWRAEDLSGSYIGATIGTYSGCAANGYSEEPATITIALTGTNFSMLAVNALTGVSCTYLGTYSQAGRMGAVIGTATCSSTPGVIGTFSAVELEANISGVTGRATATFGSCAWTGRVGGLRRGS
jgi:hypothetical protein